MGPIGSDNRANGMYQFLIMEIVNFYSLTVFFICYILYTVVHNGFSHLIVILFSIGDKYVAESANFVGLHNDGTSTRDDEVMPSFYNPPTPTFYFHFVFKFYGLKLA